MVEIPVRTFFESQKLDFVVENRFNGPLYKVCLCWGYEDIMPLQHLRKLNFSLNQFNQRNFAKDKAFRLLNLRILLRKCGLFQSTPWALSHVDDESAVCNCFMWSGISVSSEIIWNMVNTDALHMKGMVYGLVITVMSTCVRCLNCDVCIKHSKFLLKENGNYTSCRHIFVDLYLMERFNRRFLLLEYGITLYHWDMGVFC